jgi:hypothetical protein
LPRTILLERRRGNFGDPDLLFQGAGIVGLDGIERSHDARIGQQPSS